MKDGLPLESPYSSLIYINNDYIEIDQSKYTGGDMEFQLSVLTAFGKSPEKTIRLIDITPTCISQTLSKDVSSMIEFEVEPQQAEVQESAKTTYQYIRNLDEITCSVSYTILNSDQETISSDGIVEINE